MNWIEQVTILDLLVKGLIVGVVVSAPLGPVGVLCIQRTLNKDDGMDLLLVWELPLVI